MTLIRDEQFEGRLDDRVVRRRGRCRRQRGRDGWYQGETTANLRVGRNLHLASASSLGLPLSVPPLFPLFLLPCVPQCVRPCVRHCVRPEFAPIAHPIVRVRLAVQSRPLPVLPIGQRQGLPLAWNLPLHPWRRHQCCLVTPPPCRQPRCCCCCPCSRCLSLRLCLLHMVDKTATSLFKLSHNYAVVPFQCAQCNYIEWH